MTSIPATPAVMSPRPTTAPSAAPAGLAVDPVRILKKYRWVLIGSAVVGLGLGVAGHFAWLALSPVWRPFALFNVSPPVSANPIQGTDPLNAEEMARFMQTEVRRMTSDAVLQRVVEDPAIVQLCPQWTAKYTKDGNLDTKGALTRMRKIVDARVVPQTNLLELSVSGKYRDECTSLVKLVREKYMQVLKDQVGRINRERTDSLRTQRDKYNADVDTMQKQRDSLIKAQKVENLAEHVDSERANLGKVNEELLKVEQLMKMSETQVASLNDQLKSPTGPVFNDDMRAEADQTPVVIQLKQLVTGMESQLQSLLNRGFTREHRDCKRLQSEIDGANQNLRERRDSEMRRLFDARLSLMQTTLDGYKSQQTKLTTDRAELAARLVDLTSILAKLTDIDRNISGTLQLKSQAEADLNRINAISDLSTVNRVVEIQFEAPPSQVTFPRPEIMVPAGLILSVGLVGGLVFLRELLDQRIKAPSDISLIPKARLLGWIPDAGEDPAGGGTPETAFRDRPQGVVAEAFRQVRSAVSRRISAADHRSILVVSAGPDAGASTIVSNLALAFGSADRRVLIIDANLRRPSQHRVFALPDSPGLCDVLGGSKTLAEAVQHTASPNVDLLAVGSRESRVIERLSAAVKGQVLAQAKAQYDIVLIDVAPAVVAGDAVALGQACDASILVVRALAEKRGMVARLRNELAETRGEFLGVLVNGVKSSSGGYLKGNIKVAAEYASGGDA